MNEPRLYMPMDWPMFFLAMAGQQDDVITAYLRALSHYWYLHCEGLKNNPEELQRICQASDSDWNRIYDILFDNNGRYFLLDKRTNMWHQKRARKEWDRWGVRKWRKYE